MRARVRAHAPREHGRQQLKAQVRLAELGEGVAHRRSRARRAVPRLGVRRRLERVGDQQHRSAAAAVGGAVGGLRRRIGKVGRARNERDADRQEVGERQRLRTALLRRSAARCRRRY